MTGQWIFIEAGDVWLFRDNKPFTAQQNFVARGQFPPTPMTVQGAVRSHLLAAALEREGRTWEDYRDGQVSAALVAQLGSPQRPGQDAAFGALKLAGPWVATLGEDGVPHPLFKAPLDLLTNDSGQHVRLTPTAQLDFHTSPPFPGWRPLAGGGDGYREAEGWLDETQFSRYLTGTVNDLGDALPDSAVFQTETRVGLALDHKRRANAEGMFYRAEFVRPCDRTGLLLHVAPGLMNSGGGWLHLGGESRVGSYQVVSSPSPVPTTGRGRVRVILLTPAWFGEGWQPADQDWSPWVGGGKLVSLVVGKPLPIGGWDAAHNRPKPLRHYVPAGSVFFFEDADLTGRPFTETPSASPDHAVMGFGTYAAGTW